MDLSAIAALDLLRNSSRKTFHASELFDLLVGASVTTQIRHTDNCLDQRQYYWWALQKGLSS
jgi:hypothetical protein